MAAVYARDGTAAVAAPRDEVLAEVLQLAGDGPSIGVAQKVPGADGLARATRDHAIERRPKPRAREAWLVPHEYRPGLTDSA
jgi:hypothetical protein